MEYIETLNRALFLTLNAGPGTEAWRIRCAIFLADSLIYLVPVLLISMWLWGPEPRRKVALRAWLVTMVGIGLNQVIGLLWFHPRPLMLGLGQTWIPHAADSSFPSDHGTVFACLGVTLYFARTFGLTLATVTAGLCVAWARIYIGVHFPLDMLGAVAVAVLAYALGTPVWRWIGDALTKWVQQLYRVVVAQPIARGWVKY